MAWNYDGSANRDYNDGNPIALTYPVSVGFWCKPRSVVATGTIFCIGNTGTTNHYFAVTQQAATAFRADAAAGGTVISASAGTPASDVWFYIVARFISATNRRISVLDTRGTLANAQATTSRAPTNANLINAWGALSLSSITQFWGGDLAEFWYTQTDIQKDGAALSNALLYQLAYEGPLVTLRVNEIVEYRSLFSEFFSKDSAGVAPALMKGADYFSKSNVRRLWNGTDQRRLKPHPPLTDNYNFTRSTRSALLV